MEKRVKLKERKFEQEQEERLEARKGGREDDGCYGMHDQQESGHLTVGPEEQSPCPEQSEGPRNKFYFCQFGAGSAISY